MMLGNRQLRATGGAGGVLWLLLMGQLLAACTGAAPAAFDASGVRAWLDQPPDGALLPLGPFTLKGHASDARGHGILTIVFMANATPVGSISTDPAAALAYAETVWTPPGPGEYLLQVQGFNEGGYAFSETSRVCVDANVKEPSLGGSGVCPPPVAPPADETPVPVAGDLDVKAAASPDPVYYGASCTDEPHVLSWEVAVIGTRPYQSVDVSYAYVPDGGAPGPAMSLALTAAGDGLHRGAIDANLDASPSLGGQPGVIRYQVVVLDTAAAEILRSPQIDVRVLPCTATPAPQISPTATLKPTVVAFTAVPAPGDINGFIYVDLDSNGTFDGADYGFGGEFVSLGAGSCYADGMANNVSSGDGSFGFSGLASGTYCVAYQGGYATTTSKSVTVSVPPGGAAGVSFGLAPPG